MEQINQSGEYTCPCSPITALDECLREKEAFGALVILESNPDIAELHEQLELTNSMIIFLADEYDVVDEVKYYLENHGLEYQESAKEGVRLYLDILNDPDLEGFDAEFSAIPSFVWPFILEIGKELAIELFKRNFKVSEVPSSLIDAVNALQQGDLLTVAGEIIDIVNVVGRNINPAWKAASFLVDGFDLGLEGNKAWKVISKMEQFGSEVIEKTLQVVKNQAGGILGKLKWKKGVGAELFGVENPQSFVNQFLALFPNVERPLFLNPLFPLEQTYHIGTLTIRFYPVSDTTGGPTLSFIGTPDFKIRFL